MLLKWEDVFQMLQADDAALAFSLARFVRVRGELSLILELQKAPSSHLTHIPFVTIPVFPPTII
jgi:hypothetical protein